MSFQHQVPDVVQPRIHPLPPKRAMNVSGVPGYEDTSHAQLRYVPVMDAKVAAPVKGACLDPTWARVQPLSSARGPATERLLPDARCSPRRAGVSAHRKNGDRSEFTGAQLHFLGGKDLVRLNVRQHERILILCSLKWTC